MNIIEREIEKRKDLIVEKDELLIECEKYRALADEIEKQALAIDVDALRAEIEELGEYLPRPVDGAIAY